MSIPISETSSRYEQLDNLVKFHHTLSPNPIIFHGSIGHAAMMGEELPSEKKFNGSKRDIDIYLPKISKDLLEDKLSVANLNQPHPIDAGLCDILLKENNRVYVQKFGVVIELKDSDVFNETVEYEIKGSNGLKIHSFSLIGALAVHTLDPRKTISGHTISDQKLQHFFDKNNAKLPVKLEQSINEFQKIYNEVHPLGKLYQQLADIYVTLTPEIIRKLPRKYTHRFMSKHTGRINPYQKENS